MCIAILNTRETTLKKQLLRNCWENNGDGAGILYIDNNKSLKTIKEMTNFDRFYDNYLDVKRKYGKRNIVLHFRISTHGRINETNCHPFIVDSSVGFVHNGMIWDVPSSKEFSDTYMFNETILKKLKPGFDQDDVILDMLELYIGTGSKLIFLNKENEFSIVNEKAGHWNLGCWFSNSSYQQVNTWVDYGGVKKQKTQIGFTPKTYEVKQQNNYWSRAEEHEEGVFCDVCDCKLYGMSELDKGLCLTCQYDEKYWNESFYGKEIDIDKELLGM